MIDLILLCFVLGVFCAGFWCRPRYKTLKQMFGALAAYLGIKNDEAE